MQVPHGIHIPQRHIFISLKGAKVRVIGNPGQTDHRNIQKLPLLSPVKPPGKAVLLIHIHVDIGNDSRHRDAAQTLKDLYARLQNFTIPPKFIDDRGLHPAAFLRFQKRHCPVKLREYAAPVDVAHQHHRRVHQLCQAHVDNILLLEIDFRRTSRSLYDNDIIFRCQRIVRIHYRREKLSLAFIVFHGAHIALNSAVHNHLAPHIRGGLEQNGIHAHIRFQPRGLCLHHLSPAHFFSVSGNKGI